MKKRILTKLNVFLGTISLVLAGCHSTRDVVAKYGPPPQPEKYGPPVEEDIRLKYGVPRERLIEKEDTIAMPVEAPEERVVCKYGVPPHLLKE